MLRYCSQPGCRTLVQSGRCVSHAQQAERGRANVDARRWYRTARWFALKAVVRREQPFCDDCEAEGVLVSWTDLDHTIPHRGDAALFWDRQNLRGKCKSHHSRKTGLGA